MKVVISGRRREKGRRGEGRKRATPCDCQNDDGMRAGSPYARGNQQAEEGGDRCRSPGDQQAKSRGDSVVCAPRPPSGEELDRGRCRRQVVEESGSKVPKKRWSWRGRWGGGNLHSNAGGAGREVLSGYDRG